MATDKERQPVLLLKTKSIPNDTYEELFSTPRDGFHFEPVFVPVLQHQFIEDGMNSFKRLLHDRQISKEKDAAYGGLIFTSQRAVEGFAKLVEEGQGDEHWPHLQDIPIYTVGPATTRALRSVPQTPPLQIFGEQTGSGDVLAPFIQQHYGEWYADRPVKPPILFLVGEKRRDIIPNFLMDPSLPPEKRIQVDETVVYGTGVMESFPSDFERVLKRTENSKGRWVVVFSPTGCDGMLQGLGMLDPVTGKVGKAPDDRNTFVLTIGPTTRTFLKKTFDFEPDACAGTPSPEGVWEGIRGFPTTRNQEIQKQTENACHT
ncbi:tetrapyrrole biosynthesis, uroporphyrinogen III synthase [Truncatella angustata]|uniref:Tetrapyrrole biosynthesis, uroporphyrinogen III synthase n=1 Tax=Truncatella angustata TaxID=152316 RepID=A0A9P8ZWI8_9PEZI|nr:tetrapyrrole biosynthesis, uroporphyrinogen III synthase [Truncatella angustata]KAH6653762.1 tetrapyrrole biosynthesis, uroporphyrinogen III synthase [Truncatella angustata]